MSEPKPNPVRYDSEGTSTSPGLGTWFDAVWWACLYAYYARK